MNQGFVERVGACVPRERLFLHLDHSLYISDMIELKDGTLLSISGSGRSVSADGGKTWGEPEPVLDAGGNRLEGGIGFLLRLKSGEIGGFCGGGDRGGQYGMSPFFCRSSDEGKTWSRPVQVGEPYNNTVMHGAAITSQGRIVVSVYTLIGRPCARRAGPCLATTWPRWDTTGTSTFSPIAGSTIRTTRARPGRPTRARGYRVLAASCS